MQTKKPRLNQKLLAALLASGIAFSAFGAEKELVIGVNDALTGPGAVYGLPQANAVQMAADEINAKGLPLYWTNGEIAYNVFGFLLYLGIWYHCWKLDYVHPLWFVLLSFINVGHCALIFHETSHYAGFKWQPLNTLVSNIVVAPIITTEEWKWDHNYLHHCFTNTNYDKDYNGHTRLLRHSPIQPHYYQHQFQHIYATVLFCLGGLSGQEALGI